MTSELQVAAVVLILYIDMPFIAVMMVEKLIEWGIVEEPKPLEGEQTP